MKKTMKNVVTIFLMAVAVAMMSQKANITQSAQSEGESYEDLEEKIKEVQPEAPENIKIGEASRIREMERIALTYEVPSVPAYSNVISAEEIRSAGTAPWGSPYLRFVHVTSVETLQNALAEAQPGDFIYIEDGIYQGNFEILADGTEDLPIILYGSRRAILEGHSIKSGYGLHLKADHWSLIGFAIRRSSKGIMADGANHNTLQALEIYQMGEEGVHFRAFSSHNILEQSWVHDVGLKNPTFGEAVYIGSAESNWQRYTEGLPDTSDYNQIVRNVLGPKVSAEGVDIKEGTTGGLVRYNTFISNGTLVVDSWVDVKGNGYTVRDNIGMYSAASSFRRPVDVYELTDGWGHDNVIHDNTSYAENWESGFNRSAFRTYSDYTAGVNIVLPERPLPYTLNELIARFPGAFRYSDSRTLLVRENIFVAPGATFLVTDGSIRTIRFISFEKRFVSLVGFRSHIKIEGNAEYPVTIQSWDTDHKAPDESITDGRAYVLMYGGQMDFDYVSFSNLGFGEGVHSGVAWKSFKEKQVKEVSYGSVTNSEFLRNYFGAYTYEAVKMYWFRNTFAHNLYYGFDPHDFSNDFVFKENIAHHNGSHGIIFSRGCDRNIIINNQSYDNVGHGIMIDDGKVNPLATDVRYAEGIPSDYNVIEHNEVWNNKDGIVLEGGIGNIVKNNDIHGSHRYGIRLKDKVSQTVISENSIQGSRRFGVFIYAASDSNIVVENKIESGRGGVSIRDSASNQVINNRISKIIGSGVLLKGNVVNSVIEANTLSGKGLHPIKAVETVGVNSQTLLGSNSLKDWHSKTKKWTPMRIAALVIQVLLYTIPAVAILFLTFFRGFGFVLRLPSFLRAGS